MLISENNPTDFDYSVDWMGIGDEDWFWNGRPMRTQQSTTVGDWVICLDLQGYASTYGQVISREGERVSVRYGEHAPILTSNVWHIKFVVPVESEEVAKQEVEKEYHLQLLGSDWYQ